jgi:beta-carotene 3-hydroxylase
MNALSATGYFLLAFVSMEAVAWLTHKYIMHGLLWPLHKDHHQKEGNSPVQKNDSFFLFFAIPGIVLIYTGVTQAGTPNLWLGLGITAYGLCYFLIHDVFIHRRIRHRFPAVNAYFIAIRKAHKDTINILLSDRVNASVCCGCL